MKTKPSVLLLLFTALFGLQSYGQVTEAEKALRTQETDTLQGWKTGGVFAVNLAQTSLTNWASGGQNSLAVNGIFSVFADLVKGKSRWDNSLGMGYGLIKQGKATGYRKTDDKIELSSKYGREAFKDFYYAALLSFRTQIAPGYDYPGDTSKVIISDLFAPAYLLLAIGLDYKPNQYFSSFISPLTAKYTIVSNRFLSDQGAFGVTPGKNLRSEVGGYLRVIYSKNDFTSEFLKNISFTSKIDLFSNYSDHPQNVDVNWETLIAMKVNKYISVSFNTQLIYDDNIKIMYDVNDPSKKGSRTQFKEILGVGFSYKF